MLINCVEFCKALADDTRQQILEMLLNGEMCVTEIAEAFDTSQPTISHHLRVLRQLDMVTHRKKGKQVYYTANRDNIVQCCGRLIAKFDTGEPCESCK